jgi:DHA1 family bicyclomycin/chloramphenicol resistance-like MFS transporter
MHKILKLIPFFLLSLLSGAETDIFMPSLPAIISQFGITVASGELMFTLNLMANAIFGLVAGDLGDKYGKKIAMEVGLVIFCVGTAMCIMSDNYTIILLGRFLEGVGISAVSVLAFVLFLAQYPADEHNARSSQLNGILTLGISGAPVLGSYLGYAFGWRSNFTFLLIFGILCLVISLYAIPKDNPALREKFAIKTLLRVYKETLMAKNFLISCLAFCLLVACYFAFVAISPVLYIQDYGVSVQQYGFFQVALTVTFGVTSLSLGWLNSNFSTKNIVITGLLGYCVLPIGIGIVIYNNIENAFVVTGIMMLVSFFASLVVSKIYVWSLSTVDEQHQGKASAILMLLRLSITSFFVQLMGHFYNNSYSCIGYVLAISVCAGLAIIAWLFIKDARFAVFMFKK